MPAARAVACPTVRPSTALLRKALLRKALLRKALARTMLPREALFLPLMAGPVRTGGR